MRENKYNKPFLIRYAHELSVDAIECVNLKNDWMQVFYGKYSFRHRNLYTGETDSVSLSETLKYIYGLKTTNKNYKGSL